MCLMPTLSAHVLLASLFQCKLKTICEWFLIKREEAVRAGEIKELTVNDSGNRNLMKYSPTLCYIFMDLKGEFEDVDAAAEGVRWKVLNPLLIFGKL